MKANHRSNIRRIIALIMASALLLLSAVLLAACSGGEATDSGAADSSTSETETADTDGSGEKSTDSTAAAQIGEFTTIDLHNNEVTEDIFAGSELTMINFWGTYCTPCIQEMPEIEKLWQEYNGRLQVLGVCIDVSDTDSEDDTYQSALNIEKETGVTYPSVLLAGGLSDFASTMQYIPTTVFVDSEGRVVSETMIGADLEGYRQFIEEYLGENGAE